MPNNHYSVYRAVTVSTSWVKILSDNKDRIKANIYNNGASDCYINTRDGVVVEQCYIIPSGTEKTIESSNALYAVSASSSDLRIEEIINA